MPLRVERSGGHTVLEVEPLSQTAFARYGTVIENPAPTLVPSAHLTELPQNAVQANQGSALKYLDVTLMRDYYSSAPSTVPAKAVMNMFVCAPRPLEPTSDASLDGHFPVKILERHPYTTQTFIPLGLSPTSSHQTRYLVIVAPSLAPSPIDEHLPVPPSSSATSETLPGRGLPDLSQVRAFLANGSQAVTYAAGTWHAPMAVMGSRPVDFVVVQFANGVGLEDCQEVDWETSETESLSVAVPRSGAKPTSGLAKL